MSILSPTVRADLNGALASRLGTARPLIAVHRGTGLGMIRENTTAAVRAAVLHGADIVEIDVARSTDGEYFVYHEGYEARDFGIDRVLGELTAAEIRALRYRWINASSSHDGFGDATLQVTPLAELLEQTEVVLNIDRAWYHWPDGLRVFDDHADPSRLLLKAPAEPHILDLLAAHPVVYPVMARADTMAGVRLALAHADVDIVGIELIAPDFGSPLAHPSLIAEIKERGLLVWANALTMRQAEFLGWNDNVSVLRSPAEGWGRLIDAGVDVIQTDWPALLRDYRTTLAN